MKTFKMIIAVTLCIVFAVSALAGCSSVQTPPEEKMNAAGNVEAEMKKTGEIAPDGQDIYDATGDAELEEPIGGMVLAGGWNIGIASGSALPEEVQTAFDKALADYDGMDFEPVAFLGSQVVAGANYAVLCKGTPVVPNATAALKVVIVYAALDGSAQILYVNDFNIGDYNTGEMSDSVDRSLPGGWFASDASECELPEEAAQAFADARQVYTAAYVDPIAVIGSQVVAGMNYAYVARVTKPGDEASALKVVIVYRDLSGTSTFTSMVPLDIAEYNR